MHLKEPAAPGQAILFQGRRDGQTDGLVRAGRVGDHQIGGKWIQAPLHAFNGGIKAFQINGNIGIGRGG